MFTSFPTKTLLSYPSHANTVGKTWLRRAFPLPFRLARLYVPLAWKLLQSAFELLKNERYGNVLLLLLLFVYPTRIVPNSLRERRQKRNPIRKAQERHTKTTQWNFNHTWMMSTNTSSRSCKIRTSICLACYATTAACVTWNFLKTLEKKT